MKRTLAAACALLALALAGSAAAGPLLPYISCLPGVACTQGGPNNTGSGDPLQTWAWKVNAAISAINSGGGGGGGGITGLTGDATGSGFGTIGVTVTGLNGQNLAALGTGLLLNTTGTGVPSIAAQTGTGSVVFSISPALVTPNLGIPSFIDLRNAVNSPPTSFPPCDPFQIVANNTAGSASPVCTSSITLQAIVIGPSGGSISYSGTGINDANYIGHLAVPTSAGLLGTNSSGQLIAVTSPSVLGISMTGITMTGNLNNVTGPSTPNWWNQVTAITGTQSGSSPFYAFNYQINDGNNASSVSGNLNTLYNTIYHMTAGWEEGRQLRADTINIGAAAQPGDNSSRIFIPYQAYTRDQGVQPRRHES